MGEGIQRFRRRDVEQQARALREQLEGQALPITETLLGVRPELPIELTDRQQDAAEPLLAIADQAGGKWPFEARRALVELCCEAQVSDESIGRALLSDIRQVFASQGVDKLSSAELAYALAEIETSSWGEWFHGKPLSTHGLARLLKPFEVFPECIRIGDITLRGYLYEQFGDAFRRYLRTESSSPRSCSAPQSATPQQTTPAATSAKFRSATEGGNVADQNAQKSTSGAHCCDVAVSDPPAGADTDGIEEDL
jgi:hypothetical protein